MKGLFMSGKLVSRLFFVFALSALITAVGGNPASAANYYFDQNGATVGDGITNGATYTWTTNAGATDWSNANVAGTGPMVAWTTGNTNVAYFGGVTGDAPGWFYNVNVDSTIGNQEGGINVGSVCVGNGHASKWHKHAELLRRRCRVVDDEQRRHADRQHQQQQQWRHKSEQQSPHAGRFRKRDLRHAGGGLSHETATLTDSLTGTLSLLSLCAHLVRHDQHVQLDVWHPRNWECLRTGKREVQHRQRHFERSGPDQRLRRRDDAQQHWFANHDQ